MATDIPALAAEFIAAHPPLDPRQQRAVLAAFRLLAEGAPFTIAALAERTDVALEEISRLLGPSMIQRDEHGHVHALGGLTLEPTSHAIEVDGRMLHTWCALDTLFVPELLGKPARVRSVCPETRRTISLTVDATGAHDVTPAGAVMSLQEADGLELTDVIGTFCCHVHFFASEMAARSWIRHRDGTYVASIAEGFECGRLYNHGRLGAALPDSLGTLREPLGSDRG